MKADLEDDRRRDPDKFLHVWEGHYSLNSEARVFRNWKVEEFEPAANAVHRFGADWGFAIDPTVLVRCHVEGRKLYVDAEAWQVGCEIDKTPALFDTIPGSRKWLIRADSARPETVSYMKRQGFRITSAIKGVGSIEDGIEFLRSFDIIVHPRCTKVAEELTLYATLWKNCGALATSRKSSRRKGRATDGTRHSARARRWTHGKWHKLHRPCPAV